MNITENKVYCVTGGGGFVANHVIDRLLEGGALVRAVGTNADGLAQLKDKYKDKIEVINGDIRDLHSVEKLISGDVEGVFHLAAFKYVGKAEIFPRECVYSNVIGTINVLNIAAERKVKFVVAASTAVSVQSSTVYGATKMLMEKIFNQYQIENPDRKFRVVRLGNILYSTGSVSYKWKESIDKGEEIVMSNGESTRFFMNVGSAVDSFFDCLDSPDSRPYVPDVKSMSLNNLLSAMLIKFATKDLNVNVVTSVVRAGENTHEKLNEEGPYSNEAEQYTVEEILEII